MDITELKNHRILPFEIANEERILKLFSWFLHSAPTIDSASAARINENRLSRNWTTFIGNWKKNQYKIYSQGYYPETVVIAQYGLDDSSTINTIIRKRG